MQNASDKIMAPALEICVKVKIMKKSMSISLGTMTKSGMAQFLKSILARTYDKSYRLR